MQQTFQATVSSESQLSQSFLGTALGLSPYAASAFRSALLAPFTLTQAPGVWAPLLNPHGPTRAAPLLADTRRKCVAGRAWYCSTFYLKHTSPQGLPGDTSNPLVSAHPSACLHGASSRLSAHALESMKLLLWSAPGRSILSGLCLVPPPGSSVPPTPSLSRLVTHVVSLAPVLHGPVGFSSYTACQMLHV